MKHLQLLGIFVLLGFLSVSCANRGKKSAENSPFSSNPYYAGTESGNSSSSASSAGSSAYPTYDDSAAYTPPEPAAAPAQTDYPSYSGGNYPSYSGGTTGNTTPNSYPGAYPNNSNTGTATIPSSGSTHTVTRGENLYRISLRYGTTVSAIQNANGLGASSTIYPGQVLQIP